MEGIGTGFAHCEIDCVPLTGTMHGADSWVWPGTEVRVVITPSPNHRGHTGKVEVIVFTSFPIGDRASFEIQAPFGHDASSDIFPE